MKRNIVKLIFLIFVIWFCVREILKSPPKVRILQLQESYL